jgi:hypothetical protein
MSIRKNIHRLANRLGIASEQFPAGHFYSVIPSISEVQKGSSQIFLKPDSIDGVDLATEKQIEILKKFQVLQEEVPFYSPEKRIRFEVENDYFSYDDAPILHYMLRHLKPRQVIEIGCGFSSACMLDTNDLYLDGAVKFTFIDVDCSALCRKLR